MSYRVTVQIFAERANFEGLEKTRQRMLPIIGKIGENASDYWEIWRECFRLLGKLERMLPIIGKIRENASDYWENWKPQIVNDPYPDSDLD
jgi:hypothetical protein